MKPMRQVKSKIEEYPKVNRLQGALYIKLPRSLVSDSLFPFHNGNIVDINILAGQLVISKPEPQQEKKGA
jgi:hypothetical protein